MDNKKVSPAILRHNLWNYVDVLAVSIFIATPPLVLHSSLDAVGRFHFAYPMIILTWVGSAFILTIASWGARFIPVTVRVGLWGASALWILFAISTGISPFILMQYVIVGVMVLLCHYLLVYLIEFDKWTKLIFPVLKIITWAILLVYSAVSASPEIMFLVLFSGFYVLSKDISFYDETRISLIPLIGLIVFYWWEIFRVQSIGSILPISFWITLASIMSFWGAGIMLWRIHLRYIARYIGWALLVSFVFLLPFLWLKEKFNDTLLAIGIGLLVSIILVAGIFRLVVLFEKKDLARIFIKKYIFQIQSEGGKYLFDRKEFKRAIPFLHVAIDASEWLGINESEVTNLKIRRAYALIETGHCAPEIPLDPLIRKFGVNDAESKKIALKLVMASSKQEKFFDEPVIRQILWQQLIDADTELRALIRKTIQSVRPFPTTALLKDFQQESNQRIRIYILKFLQETGTASALFLQGECFPNLFDAFEATNPRVHYLAEDVIIEAGQKSSKMLLAGLERSRRDVREFAMHRLIELGQLDAAVEHIKQNIPKLEHEKLLTIRELWLAHTNLDSEISFGDEIAELGNLYGIDVLANLLNTPTDQEAIHSAWQNVLEAVRNQLTDIIWSSDVDNARRAARLYLQDANLIQKILQIMKDGKFEEKCYPAHLTARLMFLLMQELPEEKPRFLDAKQNISFEKNVDATIQIKVQLAASSKDTDTLHLPIPMIHLTPDHAVLLLVNQETYRLGIQIKSSISRPGRLKFFAITDTVDIPEYAREVNPEKPNLSPKIEYSLFPNKTAAFEDRLTLTQHINSRKQRLMSYDLFVCDPDVLNGLRL